jgi:hypothetical protein
MTAIGPGDLIEAIEDYNSRGYVITRGRIYVCSGVAPSDHFLGECEHGPRCRAGGMLVREAETPPGYFWCAAMFRPVGRPAESMIAGLTIGARDDRRVAA